MNKYIVYALVALTTATATFAAGEKISQLTEYPEPNWISTDLFPVVDVTTSITKKTTVGDFDLRFEPKQTHGSISTSTTGVSVGSGASSTVGPKCLYRYSNGKHKPPRSFVVN
jgi:hypothetical protein